MGNHAYVNRALLTLAVVAVAAAAPAVGASAAPSTPAECHASQLRVVDVDSEGAAGTWYTQFKITSSVPCVLDGRFQGRGYSRDHLLLFGRTASGRGSSHPVLVAPGKPGYFTVYSADHTPSGKACPAAVLLVLTPPTTAGQLTAHVRRVNACSGSRPYVTPVRDSASPKGPVTAT